MENLRDRRTVDLATSEEKLKKLVAQPSLKQFKIFHENLVAVERAKVELTLNRPIYVGFTTLDLSLHQAKVSRLDTTIYRYRFPHVSNSNG